MSALRGVGGIFLSAEKPTTPHPVTQHGLFPHHPDESSLIECCNQANANFHKTHAKLANGVLTHVRHVVVYLNFRLSLWQRNLDNAYEEVTTTPSPALSAPYILAKTALHKKVEINMLWSALMDKRIDASNMHDGLNCVLDDLRAIARQTRQYPCLPQQVTQSSLALIDQSIAAIHHTRLCQSAEQISAYRDHYLRDTAELMSTLNQLACDIQITGLRNIMTSWQRDYGVNTEGARVMVVGAKDPRKEMIETTCFQSFYEEEGIADAENKGYVIYIESPVEQMSAIKIEDLIKAYGKHMLNKQIGKQILGDERAMEKDVLGPYAQSTIDRLRETISRCPLSS